MSNITTTTTSSGSTITGTVTVTQGTMNGGWSSTWGGLCPTCGSVYGSGNCLCWQGNVYPNVTTNICYLCQQPIVFGGFPHNCSSTTGTNIIYTGTFSGPVFNLLDCKEIATDALLDYALNSLFIGGDVTVPDTLGDCFIKVNNNWISLFPLVFSAIEIGKESEGIKFFYIKEVKEKVVKSDGKIQFQQVSLVEIKDNLDIIQLVERAKSYLNK